MPFGKARWIDENGRSHNWSGEVASTNRNQVESQIRSQTGAKKVILSSVTPNDGSAYRNSVREHNERERERFAEMEERLKSGGSSSANSSRNYSTPRYSSSFSSGSSMDIGTSMGLLVLVGGLWLFFSFAPFVLMFVFGAGASWISEKITGQSLEEYTSRDDDKGHSKAAIVLALTLLAGGFGFVKGDEIKKGFDAPQDVPAQIKSK